MIPVTFNVRLASFLLAALASGCGTSEFTGATGRSRVGAQPDAAPGPENGGEEGAALPGTETPGTDDAVPGGPEGVPGSPTTDPADPADPDEPTVDTTPGPPAIDPFCAGLSAPLDDDDFIFPPKEAPLARTAPADCRGGFEIGNLDDTSYTISATQPSRDLRLEIDVATYREPDTIRITGTAADGTSYPIFDTCRMRTAKYADPTWGRERPPEDSIRSYRAVLKPGTTALTFDFTGSDSPQYLRVVGLCDFAVTPPVDHSSSKWRLVTVP